MTLEVIGVVGRLESDKYGGSEERDSNQRVPGEGGKGRRAPRILDADHPDRLSDESYNPLRHRLENAHAAVEAAAVEARSTQPMRGYLGSRMTTGIGRSVRFW
jgi:hypothetical protein